MLGTEKRGPLDCLSLDWNRSDPGVSQLKRSCLDGTALGTRSANNLHFAAFVKPSERGQRLYQLLLSLVAASHLQAGMERAVLTVDVTNSPAIKTVRRLGFRARASTKLVRWNRWGWASYSLAHGNRALHLWALPWGRL